LSSSRFIYAHKLIVYCEKAKKELHGWGGIEEHLVKHDDVRVKGYTDDIDSLLVFVSELCSP
jgi:hypothetical protein